MTFRTLKRRLRHAKELGIFPPSWKKLKYLRRFWNDYRMFPGKVKLYPILSDYEANAGEVTPHYFHQDLWAARLIHKLKPSQHVDIGSRLDGFIAHVLTFTEVHYVDIRPLQDEVEGLHFVQSDATKLEAFDDKSILSLSSLHAAEHFGLGRYGDPIDPNACFSFMKAMQRALAIGGRLYFSTPIGKERVEFNAHRVFSPDTILKMFDELDLISFSAVDDQNRLIGNCKPSSFREASFSCGLFEFGRSA